MEIIERKIPNINLILLQLNSDSEAFVYSPCCTVQSQHNRVFLKHTELAIMEILATQVLVLEKQNFT